MSDLNDNMMKEIKLLTIGIVMLFASNSIFSQVSVNVNVGNPPSWGPAGYASVNYYYLPDIQVYYDVPAAQFIYLNGGTWIRSRNLPGHYKNYDLYNGYKVVLNNYYGSRPYTYFNKHKVKYYKGYKGKSQKAIGHKSNFNNDNKWHDDNRNKHGNISQGHKVKKK